MRRPDPKSYENGETRKRVEFLGLRRPDEGPLSDSADGKADLQARTPGWRGPDRHTPVMGHDDLLHQGETKASALLLGGEERAKHAIARLGWIPGPLSWTLILTRPCSRSTLPSMMIDGVLPLPAQASRAFRTRLLTAWRRRTSSPSMVGNEPCTMTSPLAPVRRCESPRRLVRQWLRGRPAPA